MKRCAVALSDGAPERPFLDTNQGETLMSRRSTIRGLGIAALLSGLAATPVAHAELLAWMQIDGIPGESVVRGHENQIELQSYSQNFGTKNCSRVVVLKALDSASPALISRAASNLLVPRVVIMLRKAGEGQQDFYKATLDNVLIDRIDLVDNDTSLNESIVLRPRSIRLEYRPQRPDGSLGTAIVSDIQCTA